MSVVDAFSHAAAYPYLIPPHSYLVANGHWEERTGGFDVAELRGRRPILASGSNQSPEQLIRKYPGPEWGVIPVSRVRVYGFDAVYSSHFSRYGALPATLASSPGAVVFLAVTWLTTEQEEHMHETEALGKNYDFGELSGVRVQTERGLVLEGVHTYLSRHGLLNRYGAPVALAAVSAEGRRYTALTQEAVLTSARDRVAPETDLRTFVETLATDEAFRTRGTERLKVDAQDPSISEFVRLKP